MAHPVEERYQDLRAAADREFFRNRNRHRRSVKCSRGCDACCFHPFSITEIEAARISARCRHRPDFAELERCSGKSGTSKPKGTYLLLKLDWHVRP